ncbi:MAG: hypothetical protein WA790_13835 [Sulfitobacter sp.]
MKAILFASVCLLNAVHSGPAMAEASEPTELAQAFVGNCVLNAGRNDKIESAASVLGFEELAGEMALMFAPQDPTAKYRGWVAKGNKPELFILGISQSILDGVEMSTCVVGNPQIDSEQVLAALRAIITLEELRYDDSESGQRYRIWGTDDITKNSFISLVDAKKLGIAGGTFSFSAPTER